MAGTWDQIGEKIELTTELSFVWVFFFGPLNMFSFFFWCALKKIIVASENIFNTCKFIIIYIIGKYNCNAPQIVLSLL